MSTPMTSNPSSSLPSDIDPALLDDWCSTDEVDLQSSNSDELEALHLVHVESRAKRNLDGQVIQHRAWKVDEAFRSDLDHCQGNWTYLFVKDNLSLTESPRNSSAVSQYRPVSSRHPVFIAPAANNAFSFDIFTY